jgi:hypothetical protein
VPILLAGRLSRAGEKLNIEYYDITRKPEVIPTTEYAMSSLSALALPQNALTAEERSRVLVLYARGLRLLFTVGSPRQTAEQWAAA